MTPSGIVVHSTGANNPNLKRYVDCPGEVGENQYSNHWNTPTPGGSKVCVHAFIGYDKNKAVRVAEILPLNICCWGVGSGSKGSYNYAPAYIQFEICEDGLTDETYFKQAFSAAAEYCAHLCRTYGISAENIVSHKEAHEKGYGSNHGDPEHWMSKFGMTMDDFRSNVSALIGTASSNNSEVSVHETAAQPDNISASEFAPYLVKVTASLLNIRKGPGTNYEKTGCITDKGTYTIVGEQTGTGAKKWGRLKSGAGWIALDYTKKV